MKVKALPVKAVLFSRTLFVHAYLACGFFALGLFSDLSARQVEVDGRNYFDLATVGEDFGMHASWLEKDKIYRLASERTTIDFIKRSRLLHINEMPVYLGFPTIELEGQLYISEADYRHVLQAILTPQAFGKSPGLRRIVIDAGHGGKDTGARNDSHNLLEKKLTLDVARRLQKLLQKAGFEVILTRSKDVYLALDQRPQIANRSRADLFISLHFNAAASLTAEGFEVFALTPQHQPSTRKPELSDKDAEKFLGNQFDPWNMLAAYHLNRSVVLKMNGEDRGVRRARFLVLKELNCPGVLVELGFVSHTQTAKTLRLSAHRQSLAQGIYEGILAYGERLKRIR